MKKLILLLAIAAFSPIGMSGCDKKADAPAEGDKKTDEKAAVLADDDLPVKGDFVEEAESSITKENYKSELDKLAGEIEKE